MSSHSYKTITGKPESNYRVLGSKHLGFAFFVTTEEQVKEILDLLRKEHHNANHVCYAWRIGWDKSRYRFSDDGEPSGTAGKPIYGQILSADLTNVLVAVVRYFGGTKLGTGGLIDAYKTAAKLVIETAAIVERLVMDHYKISFSYTDMPAVMKLLKEVEMEKISSNFADHCELECLIHSEKCTWLQNEMEKIEGVVCLHLGRS